jgi:16S rRNA (guanine527-N7)-methyltransferase
LIPKSSKVLDVGCGAGFPTLPLAIFRPDLLITAIDSTAKRIEYVNSTASKLDLNNVTAISARAEEIAHTPAFRENFDIVTARAVASLPILTELCLPMVKTGGTFIAMKGSKADEELVSSQKAIQICGGKIRKIFQPSLANQDNSCETRYLIQIDKLSATPLNYPRHFSKISKKPL